MHRSKCRAETHTLPHQCVTPVIFCCQPPLSPPPRSPAYSPSGGGIGSGLPQDHFVVPSTTLLLSLQRFVLSPNPFPLLLHPQPPSRRTDKSSPFCIICLTAPLFCAEISTVAVASHHFLECLLRGPVIGLIDFPQTLGHVPL